MAVRKVRIWPDPALKQMASPVAVVDDEIGELINDLFDTMYHENGVGLAATQLGVNQQVVVIDLDPKGHAKDDEEVRQDLESWLFNAPIVLINPKIIETSKEKISWEEGCLSIPGINESVKRYEWVRVQALDARGKEMTIDATGLYSVCLQHEIDHLNGRVFVEYLSKLKRDVIRRKMERLRVEKEVE